MNQRVSEATSTPARKSSLAQAFRQNLWLFPLLGLLVGGFCACLIVGAALTYKTNPQLVRFLYTPTPSPACVEPALTLGTVRFRIESIELAPDDSIQVPADQSGVAYWVAGTTPHYVFALSPITENLALGTSVKVGDAATVQWADCGLESFVVKSVSIGPPDMNALYNQTGSGIAVFLQGRSVGGIVIDSGWPEVTPTQSVGTPVPEASETEANVIQAEVSFLETTTSEDGTTITMGIEIRNTGTQAISLSVGDISLTPENGQPLPLLEVKPALPLKIQLGASQSMDLTFPQPPSGLAVFKILDFSVEFYY